MQKEQPFTQTHTLVLRGCDRETLLSPRTPQAVLQLRRAFAKIVERESGFNIRRYPDGRLKLEVDPFGERYGFTATIILAESHIAVHTYPEEEYGRQVEILFNLCYLSVDHVESLEKASHYFRLHFRAPWGRFFSSPRNYLTPYVTPHPL